MVPKRYSHQANLVVQMAIGEANSFAQGAYLLTIVVKRHTLLKFGKLFLYLNRKVSTLVLCSFRAIQLLRVLNHFGVVWLSLTGN